MAINFESATSDGWRCTICGSLVWQGGFHSCGGTPTYQPAINPTPLYTIQRCPVCEGRGNVPAGFYSRMNVATLTSSEQCQTCDGKGILKVGMLGTVEKIP